MSEIKVKKYYIFVWGCQMNKADAQRMAGDYQSRGWEESETPEEADEIVLTTCSVRKSAEDRVLGTVKNLLAKFRESKRRPKIILTGCMLHYGIDKLREKLPDIDEFLPISQVGFNNQSVRKGDKTALIPISTGCNSFCTFCIVPLSREREKSRPEEEIMAEVDQVVREGFTEIMLLGQNVNSWGLEKIGMSLRKRLDENRDIPAPQTQYLPFEGKPPFVRLLERVAETKGVTKVQFITANPWDFHQELIDCIATHPNIDRLIHLPVQSGDNTVLKRMNRGYTREQYLNLIKKLREAVPGVEFGTDIIVGFPGETKEQFDNTVDLCKQVGYKVAYVARYSPRPGTAAAKLFPDDVSDAEKKRRWRTLERLVNKDKCAPYDKDAPEGE